MVGWLYIEGQVAAPVHVLDIDPATGVMGIEVAGKFVPDRAELRGEVVVEHYGWKTRRRVRCLGAERIGTQLLIEAVDVGRASPPAADRPDPRGEAEDWLVVDGQAVCRATGFTAGAVREQRAETSNTNETPSTTPSGGGAGGGAYCMMHVSREAWRDLRVGDRAPLAAVGATVVTSGLPRPDDGDRPDRPTAPHAGTITPRLVPTPLHGDAAPPEVKVVRLREREVVHLTPLASDWSADTTLVVARVDRVEGLGA